jgi:hypothetical protein
MLSQKGLPAKSFGGYWQYQTISLIIYRRLFNLWGKAFYIGKATGSRSGFVKVASAINTEMGMFSLPRYNRNK